MDLWIWLVALYLLQCAAWLPRGAQLFVRPLTKWVVAGGPGWRLLHPLPSGSAALALRLPLVERGGRLHGRGGASWWGGRDWGDCGPAVERGALGGASARGSVVGAAGVPLGRGLGPVHAAALAALLRELAGGDRESARKRVAEALAQGLSPAGYAAARARVDAATGWLGWSSDLYWLGLFGLLPAFVLGFGEERGLLLVLPILVALHLVTLAALARAHRRLRPGRRGALIESLVVAACYPPILLREHHTLRSQELSGFHPAVVAAALLPGAQWRAFLRAELVRASARCEASVRPLPELGLDELERRALWDLAHELGETADSLLAPPSGCSPLAAAYCPACWCEYRRAAGSCTDCGVPLVPIGAGAAGAGR